MSFHIILIYFYNVLRNKLTYNAILREKPDFKFNMCLWNTVPMQNQLV